MKHPITLRSMVQSRGSDGSVINTPTALATVWARMTPLSGSEDYVAAGIKASVVYEVWIDYLATLTSKCDFLSGARVFDIKSLRNFDELSRWWVIVAVEHV
jgi:SPP1 family predicted phage head-tail adaptor